MKKKILALLLTAALCLSLSVPCFAALKPAVEITKTEMETNSVGGVTTNIYYCNNSDKTIKYITWYMTPYNAVGDAVACSISGQSQIAGKTTGPIEPMQTKAADSSQSLSNKDLKTDNPFYTYKHTSYRINTGYKNALIPYQTVNVDKFGNYFVEIYDWTTSKESYVYLTDDEITNYMHSSRWAMFKNVWYNGSIRNFKVNKAVVEFMDGSKQTISEDQLYGDKYNHVLQNMPFLDTVGQYAAVYNYKDYMK